MTDQQPIEGKDELIIILKNIGGLTDVLIPFEAGLLILDKPELCSLYFGLLYLDNFGILQTMTKQEISEILGYSLPTFNLYRDALQSVGLITIKPRGHIKEIHFNKVKRIADFQLPRTNRKVYLENLRSKIIAVTPEYVESLRQIELKKVAKEQLHLLVDEKAKEIVKKKEVKKKSIEQRFPAEDYTLVISAYKKYKGVGLLGPEINRARGAIKQMFLAQRSIKQIVDCMKFFSEHSHLEEYKWLSSWTLETVMKKLPEFVAGSLKVRTMDDDYEDI